ncbi:MAG: RNA polymerase sigma factor [Firmicutes bacterium]|nr:RNA polymerase sigma factor [Bacillota bacterium]
MRENFLKEVMDKFGDTVLRVAVSVCGNLSDAEDVFSDVFFTLWRINKSFSSAEHLKAYLIRIAINKAKNIKKSAYNRHRATLHENIFTEFPEKNLDVQNALEKLKPRERSVIYLHYYEGYSYAEIAKMLSIREASARSIALRAREEMREVLSE